MGARKNIDEIEDIVNNLGYDFIDEYMAERSRRRIVLKNKDGYFLDTSLNSLTDKRNSGLKFFHSSNKYTLENIKIYLSNNNKKFSLSDKNTQFTNSHTNLVFYCSVCKNNFEMNWNHIYNGNYGCNICSGHCVSYETSLAFLQPDISSEWFFQENNLTPNDVRAFSSKDVVWKCKECSHIWKTSISNRSSGKGCPVCAQKKKGASQRSNIDKFKELVYNLVDDEYFVLGEYKNARTKTLMKHNICNFEWGITPDKFRQGQRCPKCNESKGEKMLNDILLFYNLKFIPQHTYNDCRYIKNLRFDFYLPNYNLCIEYHGPQHFEPIDFSGKGDTWAEEEFRKNQIRDQIKRDYCFNNQINLLEIPYWDFNDIESILESEIKQLKQSEPSNYYVHN